MCKNLKCVKSTSNTEMEIRMTKKKSGFLAAAIVFIFLLLISGYFFFSSKKGTEPISRSSFLLDTIVTITIYDTSKEYIIDECFQLCKEYESQLSRTIESSEISQFNDRQPDMQEFELSQTTSELIERGLYYSQISDGAFDITIEPISSLWDFKSSNPTLPSIQELKTALSSVGYQNLSLNGSVISASSPNTRIDLGAIAKGFIADKIKLYLLEQGITSAIINLGGNILCVGSKPDGSPFYIGIQKPFENRNEIIETVQITDYSVVSSGIYERYFRVGGKLYHHILNPKTGYPYDNHLISVTIISKYSVDGDGLSTACFSMGLEKGMALINSIPDTYAMFITEDNSLHYSEGFSDLLLNESEK